MRLCLQYAGAVCLRRGTVGLDDFTPAALADPVTLALARRLAVVEDGNPDPNALAPQRAEIDLAEGRTVACTVDAVLGSPEWPLSPEARGSKLAACWSSLGSLPSEQGAKLWETVAALDTLDDVRVIAPLASPARAG